MESSSDDTYFVLELLVLYGCPFFGTLEGSTSVLTDSVDEPESESDSLTRFIVSGSLRSFLIDLFLGRLLSFDIFVFSSLFPIESCLYSPFGVHFLFRSLSISGLLLVTTLPTVSVVVSILPVSGSIFTLLSRVGLLTSTSSFMQTFSSLGISSDIRFLENSSFKSFIIFLSSSIFILLSVSLPSFLSSGLFRPLLSVLIAKSCSFELSESSESISDPFDSTSVSSLTDGLRRYS